jgi:hypothetical protein
MASSFSSSPVTELTSGRPLATFSAASIAAVTELSIDSGRRPVPERFRVFAPEAGLGLVRVDRGHAGIDVEHGGASGNLAKRVLDHGVEIAFHHFCRQLLAAGRIDAFADHAEGLIKADDHFLVAEATMVRVMFDPCSEDIKNCLCGYTILPQRCKPPG